MLPPSRDTLLRAVQRQGSPRFIPPTVGGIDDWAWRRNQRYGTLVCDLERRRTVALLPDREPATAEAWLSVQPQIAIVARDRGGGYALAAAKALPKATGSASPSDPTCPNSPISSAVAGRQPDSPLTKSAWVDSLSS